MEFIDKNTDGLKAGKPEEKLGIRSSDTCELYFDQVRVSKKNLVGNEEQGGCYGTHGKVRLQWENTRKNVNQNNVNQSRQDIDTLNNFVQELPYGTVLRHHIVGDIGKEKKSSVQNKKIVNK